MQFLKIFFKNCKILFNLDRHIKTTKYSPLYDVRKQKIMIRNPYLQCFLFSLKLMNFFKRNYILTSIEVDFMVSFDSSKYQKLWKLLKTSPPGPPYHSWESI